MPEWPRPGKAGLGTSASAPKTVAGLHRVEPMYQAVFLQCVAALPAPIQKTLSESDSHHSPVLSASDLGAFRRRRQENSTTAAELLRGPPDGTTRLRIPCSVRLLQRHEPPHESPVSPASGHRLRNSQFGVFLLLRHLASALAPVRSTYRQRPARASLRTAPLHPQRFAPWGRLLRLMRTVQPTLDNGPWMQFFPGSASIRICR